MQTKATFTPCFDWVVRVTQSSSAALAYGVIWRYAQMRGARCYASRERLSSELAWSRKRIARHIQILLSHRLIRCTNPDAVGVPREYLPVSEGEWSASGSPPPCTRPQYSRAEPQHPGARVGAEGDDASPTDETPQARETPRRTPGDETSLVPETFRPTRNTIRNTMRKPKGARPGAAPPSSAPSPRARGPTPVPGGEGRRPRATDPRTLLPAMQLYKRVTGTYPPRVLYDQVLAAMGAEPDEARLRSCYQAWCARGYNPRSLAWLFDWYTNGGPPPRRSPRAGEREAAPGSPRNAGPPASAADFSRWHEYQQRIQNGEDPDEAKRQLGL